MSYRSHGSAQRCPILWGASFPSSRCGARNRCALFASFFLVFALFVVPVEGSAQGEVGTVAGRVRSASDGLAVASALITVDGTNLRGYTDASGSFRIAGVPVGDRSLTVERIGFQRLVLPVTVSATALASEGIEVRMSPEPVLVSGVVVTTTGELQRRVESPTSVGRIEGEQIREISPSHPAEIMNRLPGVWVSPTSGEGHMTAIRQPITTNPVYLFLEDGVPTRSPGFFNHNALYEINIPQSDRVEVVRGPGTALYGSDAIGGVIDVGTRPPSATPQMETLVEGSSLGFRRVLLSGSGMQGANGFRGDLNYTIGDDWRDHGEYDRESASVRWDRRLSASTSLRTTATYSSIFQSDPSVISRDQLETDRSVNTHPITYREVKAFRLQSQIERWGESSLLQVTPFVRWNSLDLMPSWMLGYDPVIYGSGHSSLGLMARYHRDLTTEGRVTFGMDIDHSPGAREEDRITVIREGGIAVDWERQERIYDYSATFTGLSPYALLQWNPLEALHLTGGVRYDAVSFAYETNLAPTQTGSHKRPENTTVRYSNLGPSLGFALTLSPEVNLYGGFRESFRAPSEGQLFRQGAAESTVDLKPVEARSFEIGVRGELSGRLAYEVSGYRMDIRNDILSYVRPEDGLTESVNAGRTRHQGVEAGLTLALPADIQADISLTRASHTYVEWSPRVNVSYEGNRLPQAPEMLASARVRTPIPGLPEGVVELEWVDMGSFWMNPENTEEYEGYSLLNLRVEAPIAYGLALSGRVMNLTDEVYAERASFNAFRGAELSPGRPRTVQLGFRYGWER